MKKLGFMALGAMLVAGSALASNTGFKLNYPLQFQAGNASNLNWISFPLYYYPNGNVASTLETSVDLCNDLNDFSTANPPPKVLTMTQWVPGAQIAKTQGCGTLKVAFNLTPGEAYAATPPAAGQVVNIVGSMNDAYAPNKAGASRIPLVYVPGNASNLNWTSLPYHSTADNAIDLCTQWQAHSGNKIATVTQWVTTQQIAKTQGCGSPKNVFNVTPGEAYAISPNATGALIGFDVY